MCVGYQCLEEEWDLAEGYDATCPRHYTRVNSGGYRGCRASHIQTDKTSNERVFCGLFCSNVDICFQSLPAEV